MIRDDILGTIGNTPVVRLNRIAPAHVEMYVRCEAFNPMASVKDRLAFAIINDAEQRGTLRPGQTVIAEVVMVSDLEVRDLAAKEGILEVERFRHPAPPRFEEHRRHRRGARPPRGCRRLHLVVVGGRTARPGTCPPPTRASPSRASATYRCSGGSALRHTSATNL